jgi:hypothetical protein
MSNPNSVYELGSCPLIPNRICTKACEWGTTYGVAGEIEGWRIP